MAQVLSPLDGRELTRGIDALCRIDRDLARVVSRFGPPPLWDREPSLVTLVQILLEQQVSQASARAAFARLERAVGAVTPQALSAVGEEALIAAGLTRQKSAYLRALGRAVIDGVIELDRLATIDDVAVRSALVTLKGIGPWSADIYLLMALGRPDVWPSSDLALATAMREVKRLRSVPTLERQLAIAEQWRPWRAVAARILWHHYLSTPRRRPRPASSAQLSVV